jgi:hypothetical protein
VPRITALFLCEVYVECLDTEQITTITSFPIIRDLDISVACISYTKQFLTRNVCIEVFWP